ncbi:MULTISPECIES: sugar isomerase domain-containing protein [unclassified Crossiella]|uniref:sugar isomerase domain-containing protein n=1 Tax=unclassified Crossiella TaxID=2620835 RepID=UPI0020005295|nr:MULTISPECIES: sugar isomerase domain-containing protein [unclassified Crossiella]MCK2243011.1 sugar isomerase domain-containing protein [Crossiella sp. S99.2]MCK2256888.1 sugar isomerase domain-containing protein [Crossiella sp. S99.1]
MGYAATVHEHLQRVEEANTEAVAQVVGLLLDVVRADGLIHTAGAGHSLAAVAETFYRAGGLACVRPIYHPELLPMHGARASTVAERRSGLAAETLGEKPFGPDDLLIVFSTSGVNPYPVELAKTAVAAGRPVVAVTSREASAAAPSRSGTTLAAESTVVLDNLVRVGDASYPADSPATAPLSSLANGFLWNLLLVGLQDAATAAGIRLPLWRSANMVGGDEANKDLMARYLPLVPVLE